MVEKFVRSDVIDFASGDVRRQRGNGSIVLQASPFARLTFQGRISISKNPVNDCMFCNTSTRFFEAEISAVIALPAARTLA